MSTDLLKSKKYQIWLVLNMYEEDCIFCQIVRKKIPSKIIYENEDILAFLDIYPISEGHTIIIPKNHYETLQEIPSNVLYKVFEVVKKLSLKLQEKLAFEGYNILQNNFEAAGQIIKHMHVHIIPRNKGDMKLRVFIPEKQATDKELNIIVDRLNSY